MRDERLNREIADFYREEFLKHRRRLNQQKGIYAESTFREVDQALGRLLEDLDRIVRVDNFEELASQLLAKIDTLTRLSSSRPTDSRVH